jgi:NTE family protein
VFANLRLVLGGLLAVSLLAQPLPEKKRPKVALVLAGGAAIGLTHIGVIRWLEENRIPVDLIVGTSMGGLVAGLYATGRTPDEMMQFVEAIDWAAAFRAQPPYSDLSFRRKEDRRVFNNQLEVGLRGGPNLPNGLVPGQEIGLILDRMTWPYSTLSSFDELPIPFRCIAVDLVKAEQVVLKDGSLPVALRATMSIPGLFTPVKVDNKILADGAVLNNLPTDVAHAVGADVIIAVDFSVGVADPKTLESLFGVANRTLTVMMLASTRRNLQFVDLLLTPDVHNFSVADYAKAKEMAEQGYQEAKRKGRFLQTLSLSEPDWAVYLAQRKKRMRPAQATPEFVEFTGTDPKSSDVMMNRLAEDVLNKPLDQAKISRDLTILTGLGRFDRVGFELVNDRGRTGLRFRASEKRHGPPFWIPGFEVSGAEIKRVTFTMGSRFTFLDLGNPGSEARIDLSLGFRSGASGEYFYRLGLSKYFIAPRAYATRDTQFLYNDRRILADLVVNNAGGGIDAGISFNRASELRAGFDIARQRGDLSVGSFSIPNLDGVVRTASMRYVYAGMDETFLARRGYRIVSSASWTFTAPSVSTGFPMFETRLTAARTVGEKGFLVLQASGGTSLGKTPILPQLFQLGGPLRLGSFGPGELRGSQYFLGSVGAFRQVLLLPPLIGSGLYAGVLYEMGDAFFDVGKVNVNHAGSVGVFTQTKLGVFFMGGSIGEQGRRKIYFSLGRFF